MEVQKKTSKWKKTVFILLAVVALMILSVQMVASWVILPRAEDLLIKRIYEKSHKRYVLNVSSTSLNIFTQKFTARGVHLNPVKISDTLKYYDPDEMDIFIPEVSVRDIDLWAALWDREIIVSNVSVTEPKITLRRHSKTDANPAQLRKHKNYYRLLRGWFHNALIKEVNIKNGYLEVYRMLDPFENVATVQSVNADFKNVSLDSLSNKKTNGYIAIGELEATLSAYSQRSPDSSYLLSVGLLEVSSKKNQVHVKNVNLLPIENPSKEILNNQLLYEVYVPEFKINKIDLEKLYESRKLKIAAIKIPNTAIKVMGNEVAERRSDSVQEINYYPLISEYLGTLHIEKILLEGARLDIVNTRTNSRRNIESTDVYLYDFRMDSSLLKKRDKLFYSDKVYIKAPNASPILPDSLFSIRRI